MDLTNIHTNPSEWNSLESKYRLKYLNLISNKNKILGDHDLNDDVFFADFIRNQQMVSKENLAINKTEFHVSGTENFNPDQPTIYCSYRIGAFMSIPAYLLRKNVDLIILSSKESYSKVVAMREIHPAFQHVEIIKVNDPRGFRRIISESRKGKSFFCLIDVGRAVNENEKHKATINFGNAQLETMIGIPYLAHVLKVPLVPIFSYREEGQNFINIQPEIDKEVYADRVEFGVKATQLLWKKFEHYFFKYPTQWESLYYVREFFKKETLEEASVNDLKNKDLAFNEERYAFLINDQKFFLFDYETCKQFNITEYMFVFFQKIQEAKSKLNVQELRSFFTTEKLIETFVQKKILIPA